MEDNKLKKGLQTLSDEQLEQATGGVSVIHGRVMACEERTTKDDCLSQQKCCWQDGKNKKCFTHPLYA